MFAALRKGTLQKAQLLQYLILVHKLSHNAFLGLFYRENFEVKGQKVRKEAHVRSAILIFWKKMPDYFVKS